MRNTDEDGVRERLVDFGVTASSTISGGASSCILVKYLKTGLLPDLQHSESSTVTVTSQTHNVYDTNISVSLSAIKWLPLTWNTLFKMNKTKILVGKKIFRTMKVQNF